MISIIGYLRNAIRGNPYYYNKCKDLSPIHIHVINNISKLPKQEVKQLENMVLNMRLGKITFIDLIDHDIELVLKYHL